MLQSDMNVTFRKCWGCDTQSTNGRDSICFSGQLRSQRYVGHDLGSGHPAAYFEKTWDVLAQKFAAVDVMLIINEDECDQLLSSVSRIWKNVISHRFLLWCYQDVLNPRELYFINNSPPMSWPKERFVAQWREVATCIPMSASFGYLSYERVARVRYDAKICHLDETRLPTNALALQVTSVFAPQGEYLIADDFIIGPGALMRKLFGFYSWFLNSTNWPWLHYLSTLEPGQINFLTGQHPGTGPSCENMLRYYLFSEQVPVQRVLASSVYVGKARRGEHACPDWPPLHPRGWPLWSTETPSHAPERSLFFGPGACRHCWRFDGPLTGAMAELFHRGTSTVPTVLDLGGGMGVYTKALLAANVAAVSVDMLECNRTILWPHCTFVWQADLTRQLSKDSRVMRLAAFQNVDSPFDIVRQMDRLGTQNISAQKMKFDWALALGIDHLPAAKVALNVRLHARSIVAAGQKSWLDRLEQHLPFLRDFGAEHHLRLFAGSTTCCADHRLLRVYRDSLVSDVVDADLLSRLVFSFDPWLKLSTEALRELNLTPTGVAVWLQALRAKHIGVNAEEHAMLMRWIEDADWDEFRVGNLSVFDVEIDGPSSTSCEETCQLGASSAHTTWKLQVFALRGGADCVRGCLSGIRQSRSHLRPPVRRLNRSGVEQLRFSPDFAGLYAYTAIGAMMRTSHLSLSADN